METTDNFGQVTVNTYSLSQNTEQAMKSGLTVDLLSYANSLEGPVEMSWPACRHRQRNSCFAQCAGRVTIHLLTYSLHGAESFLRS